MSGSFSKTTFGSLGAGFAYNNQTVTAGVNIDFRPLAGNLRLSTIALAAGGLTTVYIGIWDGATPTQGITGAASMTSLMITGQSYNNIGLMLHNGSAGSLAYAHTYFDFAL